MSSEAKVPMLEAYAVPDIFVSGLGQVESMGGGCFRFSFFARQQIGDREELVLVAKLIAPMEAVPPALTMAAKAVGVEMVKCACQARLRLN